MGPAPLGATHRPSPSSREAVAADLMTSVISAAAAAHLAGVAVVGRTPTDLAHGASLADRNGLFRIAAPAGGTP